LFEILGNADIVFNPNRPELNHKLGIDWRTLTARFPKLIVVSVTFFGAESRYKNLRGGDLVATHMSGVGYETPWRQVEAMLKQAAARTPGIKTEPAPFVQQLALADFAVTYELNVYCDKPQGMASLRTALHANVLDLFNEYGVQIMTPAYEGDPAQPKLVPREQWFAAPALRPDGGPARAGS